MKKITLQQLTVIWDDYDKFELPDLPEDLRGSLSAVEQALVVINNYYARLGEYEPIWKEKIDWQEMQIQQIEDEMREILMQGRLRLAEIPKNFLKNRDLMDAYIIKEMYSEEFRELKEKQSELKKELMELRGHYNRLLRKLKTASKMMENAKTILRAQSAELYHQVG